MQRTTISLPEEVLDRLKVLAAERRTSVAAVIRESLEETARPAKTPQIRYVPKGRALRTANAIFDKYDDAFKKMAE